MEPRPTCPRCQRPESVCYCAWLPTLPTRTHIVLVQHPREEGMPIGTARMASLCLPNSELHVGLRVADQPRLQAALSTPGRQAVLLYPGEGAEDLLTHPPEEAITLVVVDGTWAQARKLVRTNPELAALPRYAFRPPAASEYRIRREPAFECVSTIESLALVLGVLEGDAERFRALLAPFRAMIDRQIECREQGAKRPTRYRGPSPPRVPAPMEALRKGAPNVVLVVAEANMWPHDAPERREPGHGSELVQWVAIRPSTGERFDVVTRPSGPLAPRTGEISELGTAAIEAGMSGRALGDAFAAFLLPTDLLCTWGRNGRLLFEETTGRTLPEGLDLRTLANTRNGGSVGTLVEFAEATGRVGEPLGRGRAGRHLAAVYAAFEDLLAAPLRTGAPLASTGGAARASGRG